MKKSLLVLLVPFFFIGNTLKSQENNPKVAIYAGYGFGNIGNIITKNIGRYISATHDVLSLESSSTGPYFAKIEFMVHPNIGLGINYVQLSSEANFYVKLSEDSTLYSATILRKGYSVTSRINFHSTGIIPYSKLDLYIGAGIGYRFTKYAFSSSKPDLFENTSFADIPVSFELTIGAKYMLHKNIGLYSELGISRAIFQLGVVGQF